MLFIFTYYSLKHYNFYLEHLYQKALFSRDLTVAELLGTLYIHIFLILTVEFVII